MRDAMEKWKARYRDQQGRMSLPLAVCCAALLVDLLPTMLAVWVIALLLITMHRRVEPCKAHTS